MIRTIHSTLLFLVAAPLVLTSCGGEEQVAEEILRPVRVQQVFSSGGDRVRKFTGRARAGVESRMSFKVSGTIRRVPVSVGTRVTAGQLLAELDPENYELQVQDAEASLSRARASERRTLNNYERVRDLYEARNASKQDLDDARAAQESESANVQSIEKKLELAQNQLRYTRLLSPIAANVAKVSVEVNENVQVGQEVVLLTGEAQIEVEVAIPEILIARIREGDDVTVEFDALPGQKILGKVTEVGVAATGTATTYPVTVVVEGSREAMRSGMAAEVSFRFEGGGTDRYTVRSVAIGEDRDGRFVYVVEPGDEPGVGIVHRREVMTAGFSTGEGIEVAQGLNDGEFVVTAGVSRLIDGQRVRFTPPQEQ